MLALPFKRYFVLMTETREREIPTNCKANFERQIKQKARNLTSR